MVFCCYALALTIVELVWISKSRVVCFVTAARAILSIAVPTRSCILSLIFTALALKLLSPVVILLMAFLSARAVRKNFLAVDQVFVGGRFPCPFGVGLVEHASGSDMFCESTDEFRVGDVDFGIGEDFL